MKVSKEFDCLTLMGSQFQADGTATPNALSPSLMDLHSIIRSGCLNEELIGTRIWLQRGIAPLDYTGAMLCRAFKTVAQCLYSMLVDI